MNHAPIKRRFGALAIIICALGAVLLFLVSADSNPTPQENVWQSHSQQQVAPPEPPPGRIHSSGFMCSAVVTGTFDATWVITGADGSLNDIGEYHTATIDQRILERSATRIKVQVTSKGFLDTRTGFPLDAAQLPADVLPFLQPSGSQQSNDPTLIQQAQVLVKDARTEAQATVAILEWVRANITYDYTFSKPTDAVSVYRNRTGICDGFSNLSVALLRAVGIPARKQIVCALWMLPHGMGHASIEIYYPDVDWVPSDPQNDENFLVPARMFTSRLGDWCGRSDTTITLDNHTDGQVLYVLRTSYSATIWPLVSSANVPAWDRYPLKVIPTSPSLMLPVANPVGDLSLQVENSSCLGRDWQVIAEALWLSPAVVTGTAAGIALFTVDATGMYTGFYTSPLTLYGMRWSPGLTWDLSRTITVNLWLLDRVYYSYLPIVAKGNR